MSRKLFKSYAECEVAYQTASKSETVLGQFVNATLNGEKVGKLRRGAYTARVVRADSASGGIVAVTFRCDGQSDYTAVYYVDDWTQRRHEWFPSSTDQEGQDMRNLMYDVVDYRNRNQDVSEAA